MNYTIQQSIPSDVASDVLLAQIKADFNQKYFQTEQVGNRLLFSRQVDRR